MADLFEIEEAEILHITEKGGVLVRAPMFDENQWIPFSVIHDNSEVYRKGDAGTLIIEEWFAIEKGWDL